MAMSDAILTRLLSLHPKIIDLSLGRMEVLLAKMGHPERHLPPVIIWPEPMAKAPPLLTCAR